MKSQLARLLAFASGIEVAEFLTCADPRIRMVVSEETMAHGRQSKQTETWYDIKDFLDLRDILDQEELPAHGEARALVDDGLTVVTHEEIADWF